MKKDAQTAFLILAHNQPRHLHRLVSNLNHRNFRFYIHVDAKSNQDKFQKYDYPENIRFLQKRIKVFHAGYSIFESMLLLLTEAIESPEIDYFFFLSGWDYPIKKPQYIHNFLEENYPKNFISFYPLVNGANLIKHIRKYYFTDFIGNAPGVFQLPLRIVQRLALMWPGNRTFLSGITPFRGSAWFCINRETVIHILEYLDKPESTALKNYCRTVCGADEILFHTIILNSHLAKSCHMFEEYCLSNHEVIIIENNAYLHYIDWDQTRENPAHLVLRDFDKIKSSPALFARKFHEEKSAELLDAIDRMIL